MRLSLDATQTEAILDQDGAEVLRLFRQADGQLLGVLNGVTLGQPVEESGKLVFDDARFGNALQTLATRAVTREAVLSEITEDTDLALFRAWEPGITVAIDDVLVFDDVLYKVVQGHTTQSGWEPPNVPALFAPYFDPAGPVPEWVQPTGAQDAYALGAHVLHNGSEWVSLVPANVWEPGAAGSESLWRVVTQE